MGQRVFARAVAIARTENSEGWRSAKSDGGRAIYPAFTGHESFAAAQTDTTEDSWQFTMSTDAAARPVAAGETMDDMATSQKLLDEIVVFVHE